MAKEVITLLFSSLLCPILFWKQGAETYLASRSQPRNHSVEVEGLHWLRPASIIIIIIINYYY